MANLAGWADPRLDRHSTAEERVRANDGSRPYAVYALVARPHDHDWNRRLAAITSVRVYTIGLDLQRSPALKRKSRGANGAPTRFPVWTQATEGLVLASRRLL